MVVWQAGTSWEVPVVPYFRSHYDVGMRFDIYAKGRLVNVTETITLEVVVEVFHASTESYAIVDSVEQVLGDAGRVFIELFRFNEITLDHVVDPVGDREV